MKPSPRRHYKKIADQLRFVLESRGYKVTYGVTAANIEINHERCKPGEIQYIPTPNPKPWWRAWWAGGGRET